MKPKRLLIVDDEADFGASVRRVAERLGFTVEVTTQGRAFKDIYKRFDPTVVVLDMVMPDVEGIELIEWLASVGCDARIVVISGFSRIYADSAERLGNAKGLLSIRKLSKPVSLADLTAALEGAEPAG